jgi:hypothetical protein
MTCVANQTPFLNVAPKALTASAFALGNLLLLINP